MTADIYRPRNSAEYQAIEARFLAVRRSTVPEGYVPNSEFVTDTPLHEYRGIAWFEAELARNPDTVFVQYYPDNEKRQNWVKPYIPGEISEMLNNSAYYESDVPQSYRNRALGETASKVWLLGERRTNSTTRTSRVSYNK